MGRSRRRGRLMERSRSLGVSRSTPAARDHDRLGWLVGFQASVGGENFNSEASTGIIFRDIPDCRIADRLSAPRHDRPCVGKSPQCFGAPQIGLFRECWPWGGLVGRAANEVRETLRDSEPVPRRLSNVIAGFDDAGERQYECAVIRGCCGKMVPHPVMVPAVVVRTSRFFPRDFEQATKDRRIEDQDPLRHHAACSVWVFNACSINPWPEIRPTFP